MHYGVFVRVCCAFCMLGNVLLAFLKNYTFNWLKLKGGGGSKAQLFEHPTAPSIGR